MIDCMYGPRPPKQFAYTHDHGDASLIFMKGRQNSLHTPTTVVMRAWCLSKGTQIVCTYVDFIIFGRQWVVGLRIWCTLHTAVNATACTLRTAYNILMNFMFKKLKFCLPKWSNMVHWLVFTERLPRTFDFCQQWGHFWKVFGEHSSTSTLRKNQRSSRNGRRPLDFAKGSRQR